MIDRSDAAELRRGLLSINPDVSHRATEPPSPSEIYTPSHHISALDPDNTLVVGIRGVGKSFWAGALGDQAAREVAASAYPKLSLERYIVAYGFMGFEGSDAPSPETLQQHAQNSDSAKLFWRVVILRALARAASINMPATYRDLMTEFFDSEERETTMRKADVDLEGNKLRLLLIFDALDTLSTNWPLLRMLGLRPD